MALKITKASDPILVEQLAVCLYAPPGVGKTSTACTASKPILLDFDKGAHRSKYRQDVVQIAAWSEVAAITAQDLADYDTVIVDTAGRALDALSAHLMAGDAKLRAKTGQLSLQGWGALKAVFTDWLKSIRTAGKDIVLLAHMDEQRSGDDVIERLDVQGGSKNEIYKAADAMGRIVLRNRKRVLTFDPTDASFGKNPGALEPLDIPHFDTEPTFLAGVIQQIKDNLNAESDAMRVERERVDTLRKSLQALNGAEAFNDKVAEFKAIAASPADKALLVSTAEDKGLLFDKGAGQFVEPEEQPEAA